MQEMFIGTGLACIIAAVVGGGLKAFGIEVPVLTSRIRQAALGVLGAVLLIIGLPSGASLGNLFGQQDKEKQDKIQTASEQKATKNPEPPSGPDDQTEPASGTMIVNLPQNPRVVAGGNTEFKVFVKDSDGTPIPDARVEISIEVGGTFSDGATLAVGHTDAHGLYKATWRTNGASSYAADTDYSAQFTVSKPSFKEFSTWVTVHVHK